LLTPAGARKGALGRFAGFSRLGTFGGTGVPSNKGFGNTIGNGSSFIWAATPKPTAQIRRTPGTNSFIWFDDTSPDRVRQASPAASRKGRIDEPDSNYPRKRLYNLRVPFYCSRKH
jgi:hypothetical protein